MAKENEIPRDAAYQLRNIYERLKKNEVSHCDIKGGNILILPDKRLVLCDADSLTKWNEVRSTCSEY